MHHKYLLSVDADIDLTDPEALFYWFANRIAMRDGALDMTEAEEATYAMGITRRIIDVMSQTPGYQCAGTRAWLGHNIILGGGETAPQAFEWLFKQVNALYVNSIPGNPFRPWSVVAAQPYDPEPVEEEGVDEEGNPVTIIVQRVVPYRAVPQSIRPWLARDLDSEGAEIPDDPILTAARLGSIQGAAEWVIE
jgi:hypothetical protein